jgi:hypothetical protein
LYTPIRAAQITSLQGSVANLQNVQLDIQNKLQFVTVSGTDMFVTGANLNIRSGLGSTEAGPNGLGNIIVGYNEIQISPVPPRNGSHNIVVGSSHGYSSYAGIVVGIQNKILAPYASVSGGIGNTASNFFVRRSPQSTDRAQVAARANETS